MRLLPSFASRHGSTDEIADVLARRPVWLLSSGPTDPVDAATDPSSLPDLSDVVARTGAREHRVFSGKVDVDVLGPVERLMVRVAHAPTGDARDADAVRLWGSEIADQLVRHPTQTGT